MVELARMVEWSISRMGKSTSFEFVTEYHHLTGAAVHISRQRRQWMDLRGSLLNELVREDWR